MMVRGTNSAGKYDHRFEFDQALKHPRDPFSWLCDDFSTEDEPCTANWAKSLKLGVSGREIAYCLSQPVRETCELQFYGLVLHIVIIYNLFKCFTMVLTLWKAQEPPLVTLGDYIASHFERSIEHTADTCLLDRQTVLAGRWREKRVPQPWLGRRYLWFSAASAKRWILCSAL